MTEPLSRPRWISYLAGFLAAVFLVVLSPDSSPPATAAPSALVYASPVHGGCYLARIDRCSIHVDPFQILLSSGSKLIRYKLVAYQVDTGVKTVLYDFSTDVSNPGPFGSSTIFSPTSVKKDFAATCSSRYQVFLQGQSNTESDLFNLGSTGVFTCPTGTFMNYLPGIRR
jgi:hypothetical protein